MDREIKYQGWNGNKLCAVKQIQFDADGNTVFWFPVKNYPNIFYQVCEKYPIREYIRRKDCKGNEIYEGDILHFNGKEWGNGVGYNFAITWVNKQACFDGAGTVSDWSEWCEVIGNIFENPELLEVK